MRNLELSTHQSFPLSSGNISQGSEAAEGRSQSSLHTWTLTQLALSPGTCQPLSTPAAHPKAQLSAGRSSPLCCALVTPRWGFPRQGGWKGFQSGNVISSRNRRSQEASAPPHPGPAETLKRELLSRIGGKLLRGSFVSTIMRSPSVQSPVLFLTLQSRHLQTPIQSAAGVGGDEGGAGAAGWGYTSPHSVQVVWGPQGLGWGCSALTALSPTR